MKNRVIYIDILRIMATFAVVLLHSAAFVGMQNLIH